MADNLTNAGIRASLGSIHYNASNYQVFSFSIALTFLAALSIFVGTFVAIQTEDFNMDAATLTGIIILDFVFVGLLFLAYNAYLRNIGKYIYGRMRPIGWKPDSSCPRYSSGTTEPSRQRSAESMMNNMEPNMMVKMDPNMSNRLMTNMAPNMSNRLMTNMSPNMSNRPMEPNMSNRPMTNMAPNMSNRPMTNMEPNMSNGLIKNMEPNMSNRPMTNMEPNMSNRPMTNMDPNMYL